MNKKMRVMTSPETVKEVGQNLVDRVLIGDQPIEVATPESDAVLVCGFPPTHDTKTTHYLPAICDECGKDIIYAHYNSQVVRKVCVNCFQDRLQKEGKDVKMDGKPITQLFGKVTEAMMMKCMLVGIALFHMEDGEFQEHFTLPKDEVRAMMDLIAEIVKDHETTGNRSREAELTQVITRLMAIADGADSKDGKETVQ